MSGSANVWSVAVRADKLMAAGAISYKGKTFVYQDMHQMNIHIPTITYIEVAVVDLEKIYP